MKMVTPKMEVYKSTKINISKRNLNFLKEILKNIPPISLPEGVEIKQNLSEREKK